MSIRYTADIMEKSHLQGIPLNTLMRMEYGDTLASEYKDDKRSVVEIALQEAGFNEASNLKEIFNYSQSTNNDNMLFPAFIKETLDVMRFDNAQEWIYPNILGGEETVSSAYMKGQYVDLGDARNQKALDWAIVEEGATIPLVEILTGRTQLQLRKIAIGVKETYESARRTTVPLAQTHLGFLSRHLGNQYTNAIVDVMINGDGNNNAIPNEMKVQTATAGTLTRKDLIGFSLDFYDISKGLIPDTYLCTRGMYEAILEIVFPNYDVAGIIPGAEFAFPQGILNGARVLYVPHINKTAAGKDRMIAINKAACVHKLTEAGSIISNTKDEPSNQTFFFYISENNAFYKKDKWSAAELSIK